ncbi:type I polyketide synthase [Amycolatopsis sp. WQ 127309]|uniref:type I polyketide synthase n=1 Tax=Amycolatopsis sp. WQ 127309 TaxID=2932773 RepID=UPI001FF3D717|nr:type I polyketide synthase [Amycolatopsis sp. WQ 127309]UOZ05348.1 SDR family NAD(P)-dependent oxidoreductase [Amycolatopsis sp. WQ 127309]
MQFGDSAAPSSIAVIGISRGGRPAPLVDDARRALANAAIVPGAWEGFPAGVFATAQADSIAAGLGVTGPVVTADVPFAAVVHLAAQSIHSGESASAIAVSVSSTGSAYFVLKSTARAVVDSDPIHCVLAGSALGRVAVVRRACERAGVDVDDIRFAWHGEFRSGETSLADLERPVDADDAVTALLELTGRFGGGEATAVLSSRDHAGNHAVLVLAEPPVRPVPVRDPFPVVPLLLSADSPESLRGQAETLRAHLDRPDSPDPLDVAHTLALARPHLTHRAVVLGADRAELTTGLADLAAGRSAVTRAGTGRKVALLFPGEGGQRPGMGRELYPRLPVFAAALDEVCEHLDAVSAWSVRDLLLGDAGTAVAPEDEALYSQDALFALQVALFRQFEHWGVRPDFVVGHSVGELAAATAAGVFALPDVCAVLAERIRLFREKTTVGGAMVALRVTEDEARESLAGLADQAAISAVNAPQSVVISGDRDVVLRIAGDWERRGRKVKQLAVDRAFHSPHMAPMAGDFERFLRGLPTRPPRIPIVPVHPGLGTEPGVVCRPEYWGAQVRGTGHFLGCVRALAAAGVDTYLDMSANGVLAALVEETLPEAASGDVLVTSALRDGRSELYAVLGTAAELHGHGVPITWSEVFGGGSGRRVHLPTEVAEPAGATRVADLPALIRAEAESLIGADFRADRTFLELGMDSVAAVELVRRLRRRTGLPIATTALFDHPTPERLAAHLDGSTPRRAVVAPRRTASDEPIAIVGMSCRFPGGVQNPDDLWQVVADGRTVLGPMPEDRGWDVAALYDPERRRPGTSYVREGGFLHDTAGFDNAFFGIGGHEALEMDPQQRLLLELAWEAFERAGIDPATLRGSDTGVYAGVAHDDYGTGPGHGGIGTRENLAIGTVCSVASGRISFTFGLQGPNLSVDTACSSSLVGVHLAATALRRGECSLALAGGVAVLSSPTVFVEFSRQGGLAPDARVKPFADGADGTAWAEGGGLFVLERYSDARRHGHPVLALIAGSAVNSDGASNGLTAPSGTAQERLLATALADAGLRPSDVDVVEAHGTGTKLGDPIEAGALLAAYGAHRAPDRPLLVGSLKSNLGHTQAAAGAAGVIKMVQSMRHGTVPATLNVDRPSEHVDWTGGLHLVTEATPWPEGAVRRAGVSSFGIGGTNAHVILQQPPAQPDVPRLTMSAVTPLWTISAGSPDALRAQAARLAAHCAAHPELADHDLGFSLATTRAALTHRAVLTGREALTALAAGKTDPGLTTGVVGEGGLAFLFAGQGSQRAGMGRHLHEWYPAFARAFDEVCAELDLPLRDVVFGADQDTLDRTEFAQPALFAVEVALFRLLEHWGIRPDLLLGHSVGELAAAHVAGVLSLPDAGRLVAARGRLMQALPARGAMYAVAATADEVGELPAEVSLAAVNGPRSVVLSGSADAVTAVAERFRAQGRRTKRLRVSHAFHSALMEPMLDGFRAVAKSLDYRPPRIPVVSDLTGRVATDEQLCSPDYWVDHVRGTVRFADGVRTLAEQGVTTFLEIGPATTLTDMAADCLDDVVDTAVLPTDDVLAAVAALHVRGHGPDWAKWYAGSGARPVPLPTYAFQRKRFWLLPEWAPEQNRADAEFWAAVASEDPRRFGGLLGTDLDVAGLLPALARWRREHDQDTEADRLRYRIGWQPVTGHDAAKRDWVVVHSADRPVPEPILAALGGTALAVDADAGRAEIAGLLRDVEPGDGLVSLLALDERPHPAGVPAGLALTTALVQAAGDVDLDVPLWCVTQAAVSTGAGDRLGAPVQAMVWGLGRVAALEHPRRWGGLVDVPSTVDHAVAERLAGVLSGTEDQVAVRASGVFARRLLRAPAAGTPAGRAWPRHGTTLITGAFGALGRHLARRLAAEGVQRLLLTGRHVDDPAFVAELTALGAEVDAVACDVADRQAVADLLAAIPADRPLTAVAHAAGVLDDGVIDALDPDRLARVLRAKADGARHLHELTDGLDAFLLFSSATGAVGNAGQANYAAANSYLDALAEQRRADGLAATALAWGPWGDGGMADAAAVGSRLRRGGMTVLDPGVAVAALATAYARDESGLVLADVDWERFGTVFATTRPSPLLAELPEACRSAAEPPEEAPTLRLTGLSAAQRRRELRDLVCRHTALILGHDSAAQIQPGRPFHEQGLSSLGVVELRNQLGARTGLRVPANAFFDHPTPLALAGYLEAGLADDPAPAATEPTESAADVLSRAEREVLLAQEDLIDG